jgi:hypothetical protein
MNWRKRVSLIIVFLLGLFTVVCSVILMIQIRQVAKDGNNFTLVLWGTAEMNVGVSIACDVIDISYLDANSLVNR